MGESATEGSPLVYEGEVVSCAVMTCWLELDIWEVASAGCEVEGSGSNSVDFSSRLPHATEKLDI